MPDAKQPLLNRLRRLEGQVRGLSKMIQEERDCMEVLTQLAAIRSALNATGDLVMEQYLQKCQTEGDQTPADIVKVMKLLRT